MPTQIFVNLPVTDLDRAKPFYTGLGAAIVPEFTDDNAACLKWTEDIYFMILRREFFQTFTERPVGDPGTAVSVLTAFSREDRAGVDEAVAAAESHGGREHGSAQDYGFMYQRSVEDPDGNVLEFFWMDPVASEKGPQTYLAEQEA